MRIDAITGERVLIDGVLRPATIRIAGGVIAGIEAVDAPAAGEVLRVPAGVAVLPGIVDTHVHINEPGRTEWEGFATATWAAALGGVTTLIDMPLNSIPPTTTVEALRAKQVAAEGKLAVDLGFWGGAVPENLGTLEPLWDAGVFGFKCFLSPSGVDEFAPLGPDQFLAAAREIAGFGGLLIVHAEDPAVLDAHPHRAGPSYPEFVRSRPDASEVAAIARVVEAVRQTGVRAHILHLSSARALDLIADARSEGLPLTVETCPHYLSFSAETIPDAAPQFKCCPPIRDAGNRDALWQALDDGIIDMIVSDHSPATTEEKWRGDGDLSAAWGGVSGLQVGFAAIVHEARLRGFGLERVSVWMSANPAAFARLAAKGRIAVGADADFAIYDPDVVWQVDARQLAHRNAISAYDGLRLDGQVVQTVLRGRLIEEATPSGRRLSRPDTSSE